MKLATKIIWGVFFLCAAAAIIAYGITGFTTIGLPTILISLFLIPVFIQSVMRINFFGIFFSIAIALIMYSQPLGLSISVWLILLAALFATIGCSILFKKFKGDFIPGNWKHHHDENFETIEDLSGDTVNCEVSFGSAIKYLNAENFTKANVSCSYGAMKVYFDKCILNPNGAVVNVDISLSGVELFFPRDWNVQDNISTSMSGVEVKGQFSHSGPAVVLNGKSSLSGVTIRSI